MKNRTRTWRPLLLCATLLAALPMVACSTAEKVKPPVVQQVIQDPAKPVLAVGSANGGAQVVVAQGQELTVKLPIDADSVIGNMDWRISDLPPMLATVGEPRFERGYRDSNAADAGGATTWRFKPLAAGQGMLRFELRRPHSLDEPRRVVAYDVTVK